MENKLADQLIEEGADLIHVRSIGGPYMACHVRRDNFTQVIVPSQVPSWLWVAKEKYFRCHFLDLSRLGKLANEYGYEIRFGPAVTGVLEKVRDGYNERQAWKKEAKLEVPVKRPFRSYQTIGAQFMFKAQRVLLADGMGAGKTAQTVGAVVLNKENGYDYKTVVVCPSSVKFAWFNEFKAVSDLRVLVMDKSGHKRIEQYEGLHLYDVIIIAYDGFLADYEEIARLFKPSILVVDECHRICNRTNRITQVLVGGRNIKNTFPLLTDLHSIYLLSGTPITNKLEDLYTIMKLLDPGLFNYTGFEKRYTMTTIKKTRNGRRYPLIEGYRNEDELKFKLNLHMLRRTKDEVLPELPEKIYQTIDIELDEEERKVYDVLKKDFKTFIRGKELTVVDKLSWLTRAQQICDSLELVPGSNAKKSSKLKELLRIVNEQASEHKIVIFSKYKTMTTIIERELQHLKPLHLNGNLSSEERQRIIDLFQTDPKHRVFISTLGAGGVGVTLTAADMVIFYDAHWAPSLNNQAADRLHRIGQKNSVNVITLRVRDSVEEHVARTWANKQRLITGMIGDEEVINKMTQEELENLL